MTEYWLVVSASALLAVAVVARGLALFKRGGPWGFVAVGARVVTVIVLAVALILSVLARGGWSPFDLSQVTVSVALATLCVHLTMTWHSGVDGAAPVVDLVALTLLLVGAFLIHPSGPLSCAQRVAPFYVQWILFILGIGGLLVAGSASLLLALRALVDARHWRLQTPSVVDLYVFLSRSTALALIALGSGLTVSVWWAWRTMGSLISADPRGMWLASTWLITAMSLLSWRFERRPGRWAAGLVVAAAVVAILGLLAAADLSSLFEI